jgi:hypothetical protein
MSREAPESIVLGLQGIKSTMRAVFNPTAVRLQTEFDAFGNPKNVAFEPRWEVWDTDATGCPYMITRVQDEDGGYQEIDQRTVDMLNFCNPARWGGDVRKMVKALVDDVNERQKESEERSNQHFAEEVGRDAAYLDKIKVVSAGVPN